MDKRYNDAIALERHPYSKNCVSVGTGDGRRQPVTERSGTNG